MTTMILPITTSGLFSSRKAHLTTVNKKPRDAWSAMPATCNMSRVCITIIGWIGIIWETPMSISPNTKEWTTILLVAQTGSQRRPRNQNTCLSRRLRLSKNNRGLMRIGRRFRNRSNSRREEGRGTRRAIRATTISPRTGRSPQTSIEIPTKIGTTGKEATRSTDPNDASHV